MPSSVLDLLAKSGLTWEESVPWGVKPRLSEPGIYIVSASADPAARSGPRKGEFSEDRLQELLRVRPELKVDGRRGDAQSLTTALQAMWVAGENIVYVGCSTGPIRARVGQFYTTKLGSRSPHAGGWPVQVLSNRDALQVHVAGASRPVRSELRILLDFMDEVAPAALAGLRDPSLPLPFANLALSHGQKKCHGITGAVEPAARRGQDRQSAPVTSGVSAGTDYPLRGDADGEFAVNVTAADIAGGRIRVGRPAKRELHFPAARQQLVVEVLGNSFEAQWDPRLGPDKERSGVIRIGRAEMRRLIGRPRLLLVQRDCSGIVRFVATDSRADGE